MTATMRAVQIAVHGGPEVLDSVTLPVPVPGPGEVLVRNAWIGVNFVDLQHRVGAPYPVGLPLVPGTEAAGLVDGVGPDIDPALIGRSVVHFGHLAGVYAEFTAVPAANVTVIPDDVPLDVAAATAMVGTTAHVLVRSATSVAGKVVVVHAAAGGTGGAVVQLAKAEGATVIGIASTAAKAAVAAGLGADGVVATDEQPDPLAAVLELTGGNGADLVFDASGAVTFESSLHMLGRRGTLVLYGAATGHPAPFQVGRLSGLTGEPGLQGSLAIRWVAGGDYLLGEARSSAMLAVLDDVRAGRLDPRIEGRFPLQDAAAAHRRLADRAVTGKLLLHTQQPVH